MIDMEVKQELLDRQEVQRGTRAHFPLRRFQDVILSLAALIVLFPILLMHELIKD